MLYKHLTGIIASSRLVLSTEINFCFNPIVAHATIEVWL